MNIPITKPSLTEVERKALLAPLDSGWLVQGPAVKAFEDAFAGFTGAPYASATTSCTTALHLAVAALGLKPGDEVVVPALTWVATANVVEYQARRRVFCDIDLRTFNVDPDAMAASVSARTVGLLPVHLFGLCAEMDAVMALARRRSLWAVEDAACGFDAWYHGRHAGTLGDVGCFSFHPRKAITTGEGGMVTTGRAEIDAAVRVLRDHGASKTDLVRHSETGGFLLAEYNRLGFNYRMTDIQGSLGSAQLSRAPSIMAARLARARRYDAMLADVEWLELPLTPDGFRHGYQSYVTLFRPEPPTLANVDRMHLRRNALMARLEARGIATRQGTHAAALLGYYADKYALRPEQFPNAYLAERLTLSLPIYAEMSDEEQDAVVVALRQEFS